MLRMSASLFNRPVLSLRADKPIATAVQPIINPHNLKILGWWCKAASGQTVLLTDNVREVSPAGLVINDEEDLSLPAELARHKEILDVRFELMGKLVKTKRQKIGKVSDYSYNDGLFVQKLYVTRSLMKVFSNEDTVIIDRTQILEVTDHYILVQDTELKAGQEEAVPAEAALPAT